MEVVNVHKRTINLPKTEVAKLLKTIATKNDKVWPKNNWPPIRFKNGFKEGEKGGHGIIRYTLEVLDPDKIIIFRFLKPEGFNGIHKFEIKSVNKKNTEIKHSIIMKTGPIATIKWILAIKWLHDALIENAFDTIENNYLKNKKHTKWSFWVKLWRFILSRT